MVFEEKVGPILTFDYTNHKGETKRRRVRVLDHIVDKVQWYEGVHHFLVCMDLEKNKQRHFMLSRMKDIKEEF